MSKISIHQHKFLLNKYRWYVSINHTNITHKFFVLYQFKGYAVKNTVIQKPDVVQNQQTSLNCQPGVILPSASYNPPSTRVQQQIVQQLSNGQIIRRPLIVGGGGVQNMMLQQPRVSSSNSATLLSTPSFGTQFIS